MNKQVIVLNSPPGSGKDTIADAIQKKLGEDKCDHLRFKTRLYTDTAELFKVDLDWLLEVATDTKEKEKANFTKLRLPTQEYGKLCEVTKKEIDNKGNKDDILISPREALIYTSEVIIKPKHGEYYFGDMLVLEIKKEVSVVSDGGFLEEFIPIIEEVGELNFFLVQWDRKGTSFKGDSRKYVSPPFGINFLRTSNSGTIDQLVTKILKWRKEVNVMYKDEKRSIFF